MERAAVHERLTGSGASSPATTWLWPGAFASTGGARARPAPSRSRSMPTSRDIMHLLHALRIALIQGLYLLAMHVPDFSGRHELTRESLIARLIQLDVETAVAKLGRDLPGDELDTSLCDFGEPATYESAESQSYGQEHAQIFEPIGRLYTLIRRIGVAVVHNVGTLG